MRAVWLMALLVLAGLAGCSEDAGPRAAEDDGFGDFELQADKDSGVIRGIVVDAAIVPVEDVSVRILGIEGFATQTDGEGHFAFSKVPAGTHFLNVSHILYTSVQFTAVVEAGVAQPPLLKIQIDRRFDQDPYLSQEHIQGYINCGYSAGLSSPCILDYTQLVYPGGLLPILYGISGDVRRFVIPITDGWQSRINEMVWEPSTGTSEALSMTISFYNRTSSHSYTNTAGTSPVRHQMDMDPERSHPDWVGPEGQHDYLVFVNPSTAGSEMPVTGTQWPVAVVLEQRFELFVNTFYYGFPPEDWSFVAGDPNPF